MASLDLLFIHVPKFNNYYRPYGSYMTINLIPMGTLALADLIHQAGYRTRILHLGVEWIERGHFTPEHYLRGKEVKVVVIPLHFHPQSYDVLEVAREVKENHPNVFIVSGGYTASLFHREILSQFPQIDAIIRGDGEAPLVSLMNAFNEGRGLKEIPNLSWREGEKIIENPLTYVASESDLNRSSYTNLSLLYDHNTYIRHIGMPFVWSKGLSKEKNRKYFHLGYPLFPLNIGRGCSGNCTWCGGGRHAQEVVNGRRGVVFRSPEAVVQSMANALAMGYEMFHIAFDPGREGEKYYAELFPLIRKNQIRTRVYFESFSLPSETFLESFAKTFILDGSILALSPESGDEHIRGRNKTFSYSNDALMKTIASAERLGIRVDLFFSMGIPGEKYPDLFKTANFRKEIKRRFKRIGRIWSSPITLEPGAPWHLFPETFGIVSTRKSFLDFYRASSPEGGGLGYFIPDYQKDGIGMDEKGFEALLKEVKCKEFCSIHLNPTKASPPFLGRLFCKYMSWQSRGSRE